MLRYATGAPSVYFGSSTPPPTISISSLNIPPTCLVTRISESNIASIRLFEKLGFRVTKKVEVFSEVEMRWFPRNPVDTPAETGGSESSGSLASF